MKRIAAIAVITAIGIGASSAVFAGGAPTPKAAQNDPFFASAHWDDDDDHYNPRRQVAPMPVPDAAAIRKAGIVRVAEVERDDGRIEVEGYDAQGSKIELHMDRTGKRVLSSRVDRERDD
jgi:hypothetical protein